MITAPSRRYLLAISMLPGLLAVISLASLDMVRSTAWAAFGAALALSATEAPAQQEAPLWQRLAPGILVVMGLMLVIQSLGG